MSCISITVASTIAIGNGNRGTIGNNYTVVIIIMVMVAIVQIQVSSLKSPNHKTIEGVRSSHGKIGNINNNYVFGEINSSENQDNIDNTQCKC